MISALAGDGETDHALGLEHEVDHLGRNFFSGTHQITFVLAIFVVGHQHKFSGAQVVQRLLYRSERHKASSASNCGFIMLKAHANWRWTTPSLQSVAL